MENNDILYRILELTKDGYDYEDLEGYTVLRFFFLNNLYDELSLKEKELYYVKLYSLFIDIGIFKYNWDNIPFSIVYEKYEGINSIKCSLNLSYYYLDEWFLIYLGFKITEKLSDLVLQINNSDGDPVLIELADNLPNWIKPYNSINRCFLLNGKIYLIPLNLMENKFKNIKLKSSLDIIKHKLEECYTDELYTSLFMNKLDSISKINDKEKTHNFTIILPKKIGYLILNYHYLILISLKYLLNSKYDLTTMNFDNNNSNNNNEDNNNNNKDLDIFFSESLIKLKICMTRTQYTRFINEGLLISLPRYFSIENWLKKYPKNLINDQTEKEMKYGILITYGLYLTFIFNPKDCSNLFIWKYIDNEFWKLKEFSEIKLESINLMKEIINLKNRDFQTIWKYLNKKVDNINNDSLDIFSSNIENINNNNTLNDSIDWLNNQEYSKKLVEDIQKIYLNNLSEDNKKDNFVEFLEQESNFEGIEVISNKLEDNDNSITDYSIDTDFSENELDDLNLIMNKMDDELRKTLKTTVPILNTVEETRKFAENTYNDSLKLEESLGLIGPATVFKDLNK